MAVMMAISVIGILAGYFLLLKKNTLGAVEAGAGYGAYVEPVGDGLVDRFSMEDAINIAIYEHADGILLRLSEEGRIQKMVEKARSMLTSLKNMVGIDFKAGIGSVRPWAVWPFEYSGQEIIYPAGYGK